MSDRIIVTGGSGRLGRSVVEGLAAAGREVVSVDRHNPEHPVPGVDYREVDLTNSTETDDAFAAVGPSEVISLAAIAVPFSAPEDVILRTNTAIAHNVTHASVAAGARTVVIASSPSIMGYGAPVEWHPPRLPLDEDVPPQPWHAYGLSKYAAEQVAAMFARQSSDVKFVSFRPCFVIAPEEWQGAPTQQGHSVRERLDDPSLSAVALFNYVDARDVTGFLLRLLDRIDDVDNGEVFFVGAADALARRPLAELIPCYFPHLGRLAENLQGSAPAFSIEKAKRLIGWIPQHSWRTELVDGGSNDTE